LNVVFITSSPRRIELIRKLKLRFKIVKPVREENILVPGNPCLTAILRAKSKIINYSIGEDEVVVSADTVVSINNQILGKPRDRSEVVKFLEMLSGKTHEVVTALYVKSKDKEYSECVRTKVVFKKLSRKEIEFYANTEEPLDKAGAYAIQGLASLFIRKIIGDYYNVMGLPMNRLYTVLKTYFKVKIDDIIER